MDRTDTQPPAEQVLNILRQRGALKASEIAAALECDRTLVNKALYGALAGQVEQDKAYRWTIRMVPEKGAPGATSAAPAGVLATLCRYYLDCLAHDAEQGCSVFASSNSGDLDYATLAELPALEAGGTWIGSISEGAQNLIKRSRNDRSALLYVGYPTLLRHHRTPKWEGFFVEPILIYTLETGAGGLLQVADEVPSLNFKALKSLGDGGNVLNDVVTLSEELGLVSGEELPTLEEIALRLQSVRPDWPWIDPPVLADRKAGSDLSDITAAGIYNQAVVILGARPNYTQGLETELKLLSGVSDSAIHGTALGQWVAGNVGAAPAGGQEPLVEVVSLNSEQRAAVHSALTAPLTVITGPPGTGKSQVVTALLANCAWRGQRVLFASKNNKAVDVVDKRINGLSARPTLIRLGSRQYEARLAEFLVGLLSATVGLEDQSEYDNSLEVQKRLASQASDINKSAEAIVAARNTVDRFEEQLESWRSVFGPSLGHLRSFDRATLLAALFAFELTVRRADKRQATWFRRLFWSVGRQKRLERLNGAAGRPEILDACEKLRLSLPPAVKIDAGVQSYGELIDSARERLRGLEAVQTYISALDSLSAMGSLESLARKQSELEEQQADNALVLWQAWVLLQPSRLSKADRQSLALYNTVLQVVLDSTRVGQAIPSASWRQYRELMPKIAHLIPCWAVTSLSAHGKLPFEAGFFDLVVIDEASQCDIASALPLLYRAKRVAVIGDPKQLTHITKLSPRQDAQLQQKQGLPVEFTHWTYAVNSLFALASTQVEGDAFVSLRDHHRSHADIIEFSNRNFYDGRLRVATPYERLSRPSAQGPAVRWFPVQGHVVRPATGGAVNDTEAQTVVRLLRRLVVEQKYGGTIGVVSPFRAQSNRIRDLVSADGSLSDALTHAEFISETAHQFQGDERDVIVFSPVVSRGIGDGSLAFLRRNGNLFNVAITRARAALYVVGDKGAARESNVDYLSAFARYTDDIQRQAERQEESALNMVLGAEYPKVAKPELVSEWEKVLYRALFQAGIRAIPQYAIDKYILDFALIDGERRLNIEVDGERYHKAWDGELMRRDRLRNQRMIELGWDVKRFWVYQVRDELEGCVKAVQMWLNEPAKAKDKVE